MDYAITVVPFPPLHPFIPLHPAHSLPPTFPPFSSCPWVTPISSLASTFPILFLISPCLFSTCDLHYLFSVPFPLLSTSHSQLITLHVISFLWFCSYSSCLLSLFLFLFFQVQLLIVVSLLSLYCLYFWSSFSYISPFTISYNKGLVMMNSFNLTLFEKHFIFPSILNESFAG